MASPSPATRRRQTPELIDIPSSSQAASTSTSSSISNKEKKQEDYYIPSPTGPRPTAIYAKSSISSKSRKGHGEARTFWDEIGGGLRLKKGEPRVLVGLLLLGAVVRLWHIERPSSVVFDEVHFGGFANKYIMAKFFMDVHPPLAKLLITLVAWVSGFKSGQFDFKDIGAEYGPAHVPYVAMRLLPAILGLFLIPVAYLTLRALQTRPTTALLGALFIMFDNGFITQSRFILLDSPLIFFTATSILFWTGFSNENAVQRDRTGKVGPFSRRWWGWLILTGLALGAVVSCKWVGLFTIATVGVLTVVQLWGLLGDLRVPIPLLFRHLMARAICLIAIPALFYMSIFGVHFAILRNSGEGDGFMSSEFQHTLDGHGMEDTFADVMIGSKITLRHLNTQGGYLHSHPHTYPGGSKQQQVTLYPHRDDNNNWLILNTTKDPLIDPLTHSPPTHVLDRAQIVLHHPSTNKKLHSHDVRAPVTEVDYQNEVSAYGFEGFDGDANDHFVIEIDQLNTDTSNGKIARQRLQTLRTRFRLRHVLTGCYLFSHKVKLPDWGFEQQEVTCNKNPSKENGLWFVETNEHAALPSDAKKVNYRKPGFLAKFLELQAVMWQTNAGLTDRHAYDSRPWAWPTLRRGINFWVKDHRQIYLIGNPVVWWLSTLSVVVYAAVRILLILRWQRGYQDFVHSKVEYYDSICGFLVLGWFLHYFPFFIMSRQLFLHHYFPALYFAILLTACAFDLATSALKPKIRLQVTGALFLLVLYSFWYFSPLTYAGVWTRGQCESAKWLKHWDFSCNDFHVTKAEYFPKVLPTIEVHPTASTTQSIIDGIAPGQNAFHQEEPKAPKSSVIPAEEEAERLYSTESVDPRQQGEVVGAVPAAPGATTLVQPPAEVAIKQQKKSEEEEKEEMEEIGRPDRPEDQPPWGAEVDDGNEEDRNEEEQGTEPEEEEDEAGEQQQEQSQPPNTEDDEEDEDEPEVPQLRIVDEDEV